MLSRDTVDAINVALNESELLDVDVDRSRRTAHVSFRVLTLTPDGGEPPDRVVRIRLQDVWRVVASLRQGRWDDDHAPAEQFSLEDLGSVVATFGGLPIYGWEFIDPPEASWASWRDRLSLDEVLADQAQGHVLEVFQSGSAPDRHLDIRVWFEMLSISTRGQQVAPADFAAGGVRWWNALYAGDPATQGHGIFPVRPAPAADPSLQTSRSDWGGLGGFLRRLRRT